MPIAPPRACLTCRKPAEDRSDYCKEHKPDVKARENQRNADRTVNDPTFGWYKRNAWVRFKKAHTQNGNVRCQRLVDGVQCTNSKVIHHHLLSPRLAPENFALFLDPRNVVGVCRDHHSDILKDDPRLYVPTRWPGLNNLSAPMAPLQHPRQTESFVSGLTPQEQSQVAAKEQSAETKPRKTAADLIALVRAGQ